MTAIEWTDVVWNPVTGCDKVSPGCAHCYAEVVAGRFWAKLYPPVLVPTAEGETARPRTFTDVQCHPERLSEPLKWRKPRKVFVNSMSDLFHEDVPDAFIFDALDVIERCPQHTFQVLTKRPQRMVEFFGGASGAGLSAPPLPNLWLGVSVENQHFADERIPLLLQTPAAVRFVSAEPLLGPLYFFRGWLGQLSWVIVGGESGAKARPLFAAWARDIVTACQAARVPVFVKQLGANVRDRNDAGFLGDEPEHWPEEIFAEDRIEHDLDGTRDGYQGAPVRIHLRSKKGGDMAEWPEDLRVREWPR